MEYNNPVIDFVIRTRKNLESIEKIAGEKKEPVYEVTQLINSLLGLIVFPQERFSISIPDVTLPELERRGWELPLTDAGFSSPADLKQLIYCLRNAVAHNNFDFLTKNRQLSGMRMWNCPPRSTHIIWQASMEITELRNFVHKFSDLLIRTSLNEKTLENPIKLNAGR